MSRPNRKLRAAVFQIRKTGQIYRGDWLHIRVGKSSSEQTLISVRKKFGNAVARNKIRRQLRRICTQLLPDGHASLLVLISVGDRSGTVTFQQLTHEVQTGFFFLGLLDS